MSTLTTTLTEEELTKLCPEWKCKVVRQMAFPDNLVEQRIAALHEANFNVGNTRELKALPFHLFMQSGVNAGMSTRQMAALEDGDEAYAGAKDFFQLQQNVEALTGVQKIIPAHAWTGALHIFNNVTVREKSIVVCNGEGFRTPLWRYHIENRVRPAKNLVHGFAKLVPMIATAPGFADIDLKKLKDLLAGPETLSYVLYDSNLETPGGELPFTIENIRAVRQLCEPKGIPIVIDGTNLTGNAFLLRERNPAIAKLNIAQVVHLICEQADVVILTGEQEMMANTGACVGVRASKTTETLETLRVVQAEVVEYEGLHTYGGMSGRDMGVFAQGLMECAVESHMVHRVNQTRYLARLLKQEGIALPPETALSSTIVVDAATFLPGHPLPQHSLAVALAVVSGIVTSPVVIAGIPLLKIFVPPRTFTANHLKFVAHALGLLFRKKDIIPRIELYYEGAVDIMSEYILNSQGADNLKTLFMNLEPATWDMEPWVIRVVEPVQEMSEEERHKSLDDAGWNTFLLKMQNGVKIDLLTDSGTNAQSTVQWAEMDRCPEVGGDGYQEVVRAVRDCYGFDQVLPTHQGRMAEFMISQGLIKGEGQVVPGNMYFTTTKFHQEFAGATFVDVIIDEAHVAQNPHQFKGNLDLKKIQNLIDSQVAKYGSPRMPYMAIAGPVNLAGGQPFSMANIKEIRDLVDKCNAKWPSDPIRLIFDATRAVENCEMIREREPGYQHMSLNTLLKEMCSYFDAATMSSKKDNLVNIGGFLAIRKSWCTRGLYEEALRISSMYDGPKGDTALGARNMAALAVGIREMLDPRYMHARLVQIRKMGKLLEDQGVPIVRPVGGHAVFLDATKFLQDASGKSLLPKEQYLAQSLAAAVFKVSGIRSMERGAVSKGRDKDGLEHFPKLETVRLTIPRRVYMDEQLLLAAYQIARLFKNNNTIKGLKMVYEPPNLRFFQGRFEPING